MWIADKEEYKTIKQVILELREELRKLAIGDGIDHVAIECVRGFVVFNILGYHYSKEEKRLQELDQKQYKTLIEAIKRWHGICRTYFEYFEHYWRCYDEGNTLAKYDVISYGESYVIGMLQVLALEEKLFNLTTRESIVQ